MASKIGRFRLCRIFCLALTLIGFGSHGGAAADENAGSSFGCTDPVAVGVYEFGAWYSKGAGFTVDLLNELSRRSSCVFVLREIPRADVWRAMSSGEIDIVTASISTAERERHARFVRFLNIRNLMIGRIGTDPRIDSIDSFLTGRKGRIGVIDGFLYGSYFDFRLRSLLGDARIVATAAPDELFELLRRGEVDAILAPSVHYFHYLNEAERKSHFYVVDTSQAVPPTSGLAFSRRRFSAWQSDNWMRLIEAMLLDRSLLALAEQHLPPRVAPMVLAR
ncbi:MAG: transporter substrate-binding domain-containing protein [Rhodospirillaceae bacterium]|nr:transporter substrate-binding domain-containing protein [Rhodospirillaceae bacterium]